MRLHKPGLANDAFYIKCISSIITALNDDAKKNQKIMHEDLASLA